MLDINQFKLDKPTLISGRIVPAGYVNATKLCIYYGRQWKNYRLFAHNRDYYSQLLRLMPTDTELIITFHTGDNKYRGAWVHPAVAAHLAFWLCPEFAVSVLCPDFLQPVGS